MFAKLKYSWGDDLEVVNNARVSFDKQSSWEFGCDVCGINIEDKEFGVCGRDGKDSGGCLGWFRSRLSSADKRLINYLARGCSNKDWQSIIEELSVQGEKESIIETLNDVRNMPTHWAPFANGIGAKFHIKAPIFVMRQVFKHKVGTVESEVSRRYVTSEPEFYVPEVWRKAADNVKQGSSDEEITMLCMGDDGEQARVLPRLSHSSGRIRQSVGVAYSQVLELYQEMLESGLCPEQARMVLPQSLYTDAIVSNSLYGWARFCIQRGDHRHAQREIVELAEDIENEMSELFPVSWAALKRVPLDVIQ